MLEKRVTYRRSSAYRTRSNNFRCVKTPGGRIVLHYIKKNVKGNGMQGIKVARPNDFRRLTSSKRTVSRAYGGVLTSNEVKDKIMRAFLIEEFRYYKKEQTGAGDKKDKKKKKKVKKMGK